MAQYAHKGQILPLVNQMIPIDKQTTFHASYDYHLNGMNQGEIIKPIGPERGYRFSGGSKVVGPKLFSTAPTAITIEGWVKTEVAGTYPTLIDFGMPGNSFYIEQNNTNILFGAYVGTGGSAFSGLTNEIQATTSGYGVWNHFALTVTSTQMIAYINGVQTGTMPTGTYNFSPLVNNAPSIAAGRNNFTGSLADIRIWNFVKTAQQIKDQMNIELNGNETGLVANWKLKEQEGLVAFDSSTNSFDGTITGTVERILIGNIFATLKKGEGKFGGAVLIEPDSTNYVINTGWSRDTSDVTITKTSMTAPTTGTTYYWSGSTKSGIGNCYLNGSSNLDYNAFALTWVASIYVKRADGKPVTNVGSFYMYADAQDDGTRINTNANPTGIIDCGNGWYRVWRTQTLARNAKISLMGLSSLDKSTEWYLHAPQLEWRDYPTSYIPVKSSRPLGKLWYSKELISPSTFTVSCWYNAPYMHRTITNNDGIVGNYWTPIIELMPTTNQGQLIGVSLVAGIDSDRRIRLRSPNSVRGLTDVQDNTWNHAILTYDGVNYKVYLNGVLEITSTGSPVVPSSDWVLMIGGGYHGKPFAMIDEVRIESRAISADEASAWAASGLHYNYLDYSYYVD